MDTTQIPAGSIVVGVDGSPSAGRALAWAVDQAVAENRPLTLVHAVSPTGAVWMDQAGIDHRIGLEAMESTARELLDMVRAEVAKRAPDLEVRDLLRVADPRDALIELSQHAAMVVLGSRGRGPVRSLLLGSVGVAVSRHAGCPVVIHRPGNPGLVRHGIVVGADATEHSRPTLEFAYRQASFRDLPLTVLHCFWDVQAAVGDAHLIDARSADFEEQHLLLAEAISGMSEKYPDVRVHTELARGLPDECLTKMGDRMNMIVVGAHHGGVASEIAFGSVAASVVEHATCPVAIVPLSGPTT
jgi:nucleotide-binding universal stress UspA family protein